MINEKEFTDMYLIAAFLAYGFERVDLDRANPNRQKFHFKDGKKLVFIKNLDGEVHKEYFDLDSTRQAFSNNMLLLPGSYPSILKSLKQDILTYKQNNNDYK